MKHIVIFSGAVAKQILDSEKGKLLTIGLNNRNKDKTVFYFEDTVELREYIAEHFDINL